MKNGWQRKQLGELAELKGRIGWRGLTAKEYTKSGPLFLSVHSLNYGDYVDFRDAFHISEARYDESPEIMLQKDDVLICKDGAGIGKVGIVGLLPDRATINSSLLHIRCGESILPKFLYLCLSSPYFQKIVNSRLNGATTPHLYQRDIKEFPVVLPPLPEQQRIVGILDEAFEDVATAKVNAEKNVQNARALFESHLQSIFTQRGDGWDRVTLETLLERGWIEGHLDGNHGGDYPRKEEFISEGVPYISANCLDDDQVEMSRAKYLSPARAALLRKGIAKDRDVLFAHNATVGPVAVIHTDEERIILGTSLTYYRCNRAYILPEYLAHYMRSFEFKSQYLQVMRQSTRNQVPITKQREFFHVIPPLDEQKIIVGQLDGLFMSGRRLATIYQRKLAALEELKKSLLHQAFTGEL